MPPPAQRRLVQALFAYLMGIATRIIVQLAALPILFAHWSAQRVGTWMMVFALPSYFVVAGAAFASAGGNLALSAAREERWDEARSAFRASLVWAIVFSVAIALGCYGAAVLVPQADVARLGLEGIDELRACALWLGIYVVAVALGSVLIVPLRVAERYPLFYTSQNVVGLAEVAVLALCVTRSESFALLASGLALLRIAYAVVMSVVAWRLCPRLFHGSVAPLGETLRTVALPSAAFMVLPMVYVLNVQGYTLIVGIAYGAALVAGFVATRVIVRAIDVVMAVIYASQFNEAGYLGPEKRDIQRRQLATMTGVTLIGALAFAVLLLTFGPQIEHLLSAGQTQFDHAVAAVLLLSGIIRALATTPQALVSADNNHGRLAIHYLIASFVCLPIALLMAQTGVPLAVVLLMLVPAVLALMVPAFRVALHHLDWSKRDLLRAMASRERVRDVAQLAHFLVRRS